jgi:hypothetical protein
MYRANTYLQNNSLNCWFRIIHSPVLTCCSCNPRDIAHRLLPTVLAHTSESYKLLLKLVDMRGGTNGCTYHYHSSSMSMHSQARSVWKIEWECAQSLTRCEIYDSLSLNCSSSLSMQRCGGVDMSDMIVFLTLSYLLFAILTTFLNVPKGSTSAILFLLANSMTSRSSPQPQPPVGGIPHSRASR